MTKRLAIIYTFLFLFAFTFGLAFTLASSAMADGGDNCCVYEWCHGPSIGIKGHFIGEWCIYDGIHPCDAIYICADPS